MELTHQQNIIRILVKGGIITPSYFLKILKIASQAGNRIISFGSRQDIIFNLPAKEIAAITQALKELKIEYWLEKHSGGKAQNIVSSFVAADIQASTQWLNSGNYIQILDLFSFPHQLRINIADPRQSMVPLFYGHINFVASPSKHYWYVYLRQPSTHELFRWPELIYSSDIPVLAKAIEETWLQNQEVKLEDLHGRVMNLCTVNHRSIEQLLEQPQSFSADYEGFGRMYESNKHWAGFYWRNNRYNIEFLEEACKLSLDTGIAKIAITPWKSFLIKDIDDKDLLKWQILLGHSGITMRHSAFDLNWHLPLNNESALRLKQFLVRQFDKRDVCVHGLTFGITNGKELPFCSVMIREHSLPGIFNRFDFLKNYDILIADKFNPNSCQYKVFKSYCRRDQLPDILTQVTRLFYKQSISGAVVVKKSEKTEQKSTLVHQCPNCFTVYLPQHGCPEMNIQPGTPFIMLPQNYCCPVCETELKSFIEIDLSTLQTT